MSVSDFQQGGRSPSRVQSEHSLLADGNQNAARVPPDWREQVMRHIESKKMEKTSLSHSHNSHNPLLWREEPGSLVSLGVALRDGPTHSALSDDSLAPPSYSLEPHRKPPLLNGGVCVRPHSSSLARHPSREQLIDYLMLKVSQQPPGPPPPPRLLAPPLQQEIRVLLEKNPELGFSISGGVGGRGNPFHPEDDGIFVTRVQPEGPASKILQPGDKILQANGYSFVSIDHGSAVSLLKTFVNTVDLTVVREA